MSTRRNSRPTAQRRGTPARRYTPYSLYRRPLHIEPLEDRRLLAVITVDSLLDTTDANDGLTTLREAIVATNLAAGADTIQFAPSLTASGPAKIVLTQGELKITDSLTIEGPGAGVITIEASAGTRIFNADDGQALNQDVAISGLTLTKSNTSGEGGAVYSRESLTLTEITVDKNTSMGAIRAVLGDGARATVSHSIVSNNTGGGIWISTAATSVVLIDNTQVVGNTTTSSGGGILLSGNLGSASITDCVIGGNASTAAPSSGGLGGGGIAFSGSGNLSINATLIANNSSQRGGGGIHIRPSGSSTFTFSDCELSNNEAQYGGGISIEAQSPTATHAIVRCQINRNSTRGSGASSEGGRGGGIHVTGGAPLHLGDLVIRENAAQTGGGIYVGGNGALLFENCSVVNNVASSSGGGLSIGRIGTVRQSTFSGNSAQTGGAISSGSLAIEYSTIANNVATGTGGGVYFSNGILSVDQSIVADNSGPPTSKDIGKVPSAMVVATFSIVGDNAGSGLAESPPGTTDGKGNRIGGPLQGPIDPLLRPLANYGGTMPTHAVAPGSPAINAGNTSAVAGIGGVPQYDQRGEPFGRVFDGQIDIGAFEFQTTAPTDLIVDLLIDESDANYSPGDLSLREALQLANLAPDANTIEFSPALTASGPAVIVLTRGALEIVGNVTIIGPSADLLTIDASGNDPTPDVKDGQGSSIFEIGDNDVELLDAQISGLTLTGGDAQYGGAILSTEKLALENCTITGNHATQLGGGLAVFYGTVRVTDCLISANTTDGTGAGIAASSSELTIENSTITDHIGGVGGGIHAFDTDVTILDSDISNNTAWGLGGAGGGIYHKGGTLSVADSTISGNISISGGGIYGESDVELTRVTMQGNYAYLHGGAVYSFGTLRIHQSTITSNSAALDGGGIRAASDVQIERSTLTENEAGRWGGAVWIDIVGAPLTITSSTISRNYATIEGGGLWITSVDLAATITHSTIDNNSTSDLFGFGGGITIRNATLLVENSTVSGNTAATGGGIYHPLGTLDIIHSTIADNSAKTGGGIYASGHLTLAYATLRDNLADLDGGGVLAAGDTYIDGSLLHNNFANRDGGAIAAESDGVVINNSTLSANSAGALGGGLWAAQTATVRHSTIFENQAGVAGGGVFLVSGSLTPDHTIVARNVAPAGPDLTGLLGASFAPRYSLIGSNAASGLAPAPVGAPDSNGNIIGGDIDPRLGPLAENGGTTLTHALLPASPAINAGDPTAAMGVNGVPTHDQRNQSHIRVYNGRIDIGAFEVQPNVLLGDYNLNGIVDAADFSVWRKTNGSVTDLRADGNGDGHVNNDDYAVWRVNFGQFWRPPVDAGSGAAAITAAPQETPSTTADPAGIANVANGSLERAERPALPKRELVRETRINNGDDQRLAGLLAWLSPPDDREEEQNQPAFADEPFESVMAEVGELSDHLTAALDEAFSNL